MKEEIQKQIKEVLEKLGIVEDIPFSVEHPEDLTNGDYSTNVAMVYAKKLGLKSKDLAEKIVATLKDSTRQDLVGISEIQVAGPGFINFYLSREFFAESINEILKKEENWGKNEILSGKKVMVEYTQPNPFKPFHIGHLMSNTIGESISRIVEFSGAKTIRANYQGDVGPHVAKALYQLLKDFDTTKSFMTKDVGIGEKAKYIGESYVIGSNLYDTDEEIKKEIDEINRKVYDKSDKKINEIYEWGRKTTLDAFEEIYKLLGTKFDYYFFESEMAKIGEKIVRENTIKTKGQESDRGIFVESNGAVVFHAEEYDPKLHTRVFINSQGLPTYETKEIGLTMTKFEKENPDISMMTTAIEQAEYMKVVQKAISLMHPDLEKKMKHVTHGMMRLADGKMSSRKGNVVTGESLIVDSMNIVLNKMKERDIEEKERIEISKKVGVSALKYSILKSSLGSDIVYDFEKSISFEGDSGPYLQYTAVRALSILRKAEEFDLETRNYSLEPNPTIMNLEKKLYIFPEVIEKSYNFLEPHHIATYLTELASEFNSFYANTQILVDDNKYMTYHINLVKAFYQTMKNGLWLLGIEIPKKM
jgi:arginyl-tRNA synthetase